MKKHTRFIPMKPPIFPSLMALALAGGAWAASPYDMPYGTQWNFSAGAAGNDVRSGNSVDVTDDGTIFVFNGAHNSVSWGEGSSGSINGGVGALTPLGNKLFGTTLRSLPGMNNPNQNYNADGHAAGNRFYSAFYANSSQYWTGEDGKDNTRAMVFSLDSSGLDSIADRHSLSVYSDTAGTLRTDSLKPITTGLTPVDGQNRISASALRKSTLDMVMVMDMVNGDFGTAGDYGGAGLAGGGTGNAFLPGIGVYNFTTNTLSGPPKQPILTSTYGNNMGVYVSAGIDQATGNYYGGGIAHSRAAGTSDSDAWDPDGSGPAASIPIVNSVLNGPRDYRATTAGIGTAYDSSHNLLYAVTWDTTGYDNINFIAPTNDGTNGCFWAGEKGDAAYIEKRDASGTVIWSDVINATIDIVPAAEVTDIQCVADVASSLNGTYFDLTGAGGTYRIWYDVDNTGVAPADPGAGLIEVDITAGATADAVAAATQAVIDAQADFGAAVSTDTVTVTDAATGDRTDVDSGTTGFTITVTTQGASFNPGVERVASVEVDSAGDVFVVGYYQNEADGGANGGSDAYDTFVRKYKKIAEDDYSLVWATSGGLPGIRDLGHDAAVDSDGTLYTFSDTYGQWDTNNPTQHTYAGNADILVQKWIPGDFADGTGAAGSDGIVDFKDVQLIGDAVKSGLTGDDTYDFNNDGDSTTADVNHLITVLMDRLIGDIAQDALVTDVDNADIGRAIGASGVGTTYLDGDMDWDGDVENDDITAVAGAFTGATSPGRYQAPGGAGATLIYRPDDGRVWIKADEAAGGAITSFQLENREGTFVPASYTGPAGGGFGGSLEDVTTHVIADTDLTLAGFAGLPSLGNVLPAGMDQAGLEAYLTTAVYTGEPGSGQMGFTLVVGDLSDYDVWALLYPGADLSDPDADFDGDGMSNDSERLFGLDPTDPASRNPVTAGLDAGAGTLSFTRRDDALTGLFSGAETSTDLMSWTRDSGAVFVSGDPDANGVETVAVTLSPGLLTGPRLFVRVVQDDGVILSENFEDDDGGFTVVTTSGFGWEHGDPDSSGFGGQTVSTGNGGSLNCWGTNIGNPGYYSNPGTDTDTCLRSGLIDLTGVDAAELTFAHAIDVEAADSVTINILDADGNEIAADIEPISDGDPNSSEWQSIGPIAIPAAALGQQVRIEWCLTGTGGTTDDFMGWYIDDVTVRRVVAP